MNADGHSAACGRNQRGRANPQMAQMNTDKKPLVPGATRGAGSSLRSGGREMHAERQSICQIALQMRRVVGGCSGRRGSMNNHRTRGHNKDLKEKDEEKGIVHPDG